MRRLPLRWLLLALLLPAPAGAEDIVGAREAERELAEQERGLLDELQALEISAERLGKAVADAASEVATAQIAVEKTRSEVAERRAAVQSRKQALGRRTRTLYRLTPRHSLRLLLSSRDRNEMLHVSAGLERVARADQEALARYRAEVQGLRAQEHTLAQEEKALRTQQEELESQRSAHAERIDERRGLLDSVRKRRELQKQLISELEAASSRLESTVEAMPESAEDAKEEASEAAGQRFKAQKGQLPAPAAGPVEIPFGKVVDPDFGAEIAHNGWAIGAEAGQPVKAVHEGRVVYAGWFKGYGRIVIIDHGQRYHTLMAHLSEILVSVGQQVSGEQVVARVGESGTTRGPHLYFELRHRGRPRNPAKWIR